MYDLTKMSLVELSDLKLAICEEKRTRKAKEEEILIAEIRQKIAILGLSADEFAKRLGGGKKGFVKPRLPGVYQDKNNPEHTWSGRGRKPLWVVNWLENGGAIDDLLIK